jgi:hypothetical protein
MARFPRWLLLALSLACLLSLALPAFADKDPPKPCMDENVKLNKQGEVSVECNSDLWPLNSLNGEVYLDSKKMTLEDIKNKLNAGFKIKADVEWKDRNGKTLNTTKVTARVVQ